MERLAAEAGLGGEEAEALADAVQRLVKLDARQREALVTFIHDLSREGGSRG